MKNPIGWFEIYVDNLSRAKIFYETVFQVELTEFSNPNINETIQMKHFPFEMQAYGATGALVKMDGVSAGAGGTIIYFSSEDCAIEAARIENAGGAIQQAKTSIGEHGFIVLARDTESNIFGIHSMQ